MVKDSKRKSRKRQPDKVDMKGLGCKSMVYIRYRDHALFLHSNPKLYTPPTLETIGWLDHETPEYIRILHERRNPLPGEKSPKLSGLVILKNTIIERRELQ